MYILLNYYISSSKYVWSFRMWFLICDSSVTSRFPQGTVIFLKCFLLYQSPRKEVISLTSAKRSIHMELFFLWRPLKIKTSFLKADKPKLLTWLWILSEYAAPTHLYFSKMQESNGKDRPIKLSPVIQIRGFKLWPASYSWCILQNSGSEDVPAQEQRER